MAISIWGGMINPTGGDRDLDVVMSKRRRWLYKRRGKTDSGD
jgi:hypothetical protein